MVCLHCLLEQGDAQLGRGLDMARLHGRHVDYDPDVQDALTGAHGQLPLFDAEASTPSSGPEFAETFRRIVTQCGVDRFLHGGRERNGVAAPGQAPRDHLGSIECYGRAERDQGCHKVFRVLLGNWRANQEEHALAITPTRLATIKRYEWPAVEAWLEKCSRPGRQSAYGARDERKSMRVAIASASVRRRTPRRPSSRRGPTSWSCRSRSR